MNDGVSDGNDFVIVVVWIRCTGGRVHERADGSREYGPVADYRRCRWAIVTSHSLSYGRLIEAGRALSWRAGVSRSHGKRGAAGDRRNSTDHAGGLIKKQSGRQSRIRSNRVRVGRIASLSNNMPFERFIQCYAGGKCHWNYSQGIVCTVIVKFSLAVSGGEKESCAVSVNV